MRSRFLAVRFESSETSDTKLYYGYLEYINAQGKSYSICNTGWDDVDANVACKEMGFKTGRAFNNLLLSSINREGMLETVQTLNHANDNRTLALSKMFLAPHSLTNIFHMQVVQVKK